MPAFQSFLAEVVAARGSAANMAARLLVGHNLDGTHKDPIPTAAEWIEDPDTVAYASTASFTVAGDKRSIYLPRRAVRLTQTGNADGFVMSASYDGGQNKTTVVVDCIVDTGLSGVEYGQAPAASPKPGHLALNQTDWAAAFQNNTYSADLVKGLRLLVRNDGEARIIAPDNGSAAGRLAFLTDETERLAIRADGVVELPSGGSIEVDGVAVSLTGHTHSVKTAKVIDSKAITTSGGTFYGRGLADAGLEYHCSRRDRHYPQQQSNYAATPGRFWSNGARPPIIAGSISAGYFPGERLHSIYTGPASIAGRCPGAPVTRSIGAAVVAGETTFSIEHYCAATRANDGYGVASSIATETYTVVLITQLSV